MPHLINLSNEDIDTEYNLDGYDAYSADGEKLGGIDGVIADSDSMQPRYVVVDSGGWFSSKQFVVPSGDISAIDDDARGVQFTSLTKQTLSSGRYPRYDESWWDRNSGDEWREYERGVAAAYETDRRADPAVDHEQELYQRPAEGAQRLELLEEHLIANKERYQAGTVKLGKRVIEHTETVNVPVREERVIIERRPVQGEAQAGAITDTNEMIEVDVMKERVVAEKETVITEEVGIRTEATERTERLQDTVRKEELVVEGDEQLVQNADAARRPESDRPQRRG